jgi:hypothetical protein
MARPSDVARSASGALAFAAFLLARAVPDAAAQNLLVNPGFDGSLAPWVVLDQNVSHSGLDAGSVPGSGSARVASSDYTGPAGRDAFAQCVPITARGPYRIGFKAYKTGPNQAPTFLKAH